MSLHPSITLTLTIRLHTIVMKLRNIYMSQFAFTVLVIQNYKKAQEWVGLMCSCKHQYQVILYS